MKTTRIILILVLALGFGDSVTANWVTLGDDMYADITGNVGIGTTSPTSLLDVFGGEIRIRRDSDQYIEIKDVDASGAYITAHSRETNKKPLIISTLHDGRDSADGAMPIIFRVGNESSPMETMRITEDGNVGIGVSYPSDKLAVKEEIETFPERIHDPFMTEPEVYHSGAVRGGLEWVDRLSSHGVSELDRLSRSHGYLGVLRRELYPISGGNVQEVHRIIGVYGGTTSGTSNIIDYGGYFEADGAEGRGVYGYASNNGDNAGNYGGYFVADGKGGVGVYAKGGAEGYAAEFDGNVLINTGGRVVTPVLEITGGSDLSEQFEIGSEGGKVKPGMVVCIDPEHPGDLIVSKKAYDRKVAGIISGAGGVKPGMLMGQKGTKADGRNPVALTGRVYCWADAAYNPIEPGDLLTTSDTAGHAMKVTEYSRAQGAIIGKAMSSLESGRGLVLVLVTLQ